MSGVIGVFQSPNGDDELNDLAASLKYRGEKITKRKGKGYSLGTMSTEELDGYPGIPIVLEGYCRAKETGELLEKKELEKMYLETGPEMLHDIEGEFILAIWNGIDDYILARDRMGVKSLYYSRKGEAFFFAPEFKALLDVGGEIDEFPPGHYYHPARGFTRYFKWPDQHKGPKIGSLEQEKKKLRDILKEEVGKMTQTDKRWGLYLSGGLDSSVVACIAAEIYNKPVDVFTVGIKGSEDIQFAKEVAQRIGARHHVYTYDLEEMLEVVPWVIYHLESFDSAFVRSSIPNYLAARLAREHGMEIMLTGEGSDEIFAGYDYLKDIESRKKINNELHKLVKKMHGTGLERVNRMNAAFGMECRLPFLAQHLVERVMNYPLEWKLKGDEEGVDKWILRECYTDELSDVAWREKQQFDQGSGSSGLLENYADKRISDADYHREKEQVEVAIRSKEELMYYGFFREKFPEKVASLVGRWVSTG